MRTTSYFPNKSQPDFPVDTAQTVPAFAATTLAATLHDSDDALELPSSIEGAHRSKTTRNGEPGWQDLAIVSKYSTSMQCIYC